MYGILGDMLYQGKNFPYYNCSMVSDGREFKSLVVDGSMIQPINNIELLLYF